MSSASDTVVKGVRYGLDTKFESLVVRDTSSKRWVATNVPDLEIRRYQLDVWDRLWSQRPQRKRMLVHLATGLGKTAISAVDVLHFKREEGGKRVLFVSHMNDISSQAGKTFKQVNPKFTTAMYRAGKPVKDVDITLATFQSLYSTLGTIPVDYFDYIIWDEAHHIEATTFKAVREYFTPKFELGLTATPERADGLDIFGYFGKPIYSKSLHEGLAEGWLSPVDYHMVLDDTLKKVVADNFDVTSVKKLRSLFDIKVRDDVIAEEVAKRQEAIGLKNAKTIVFCHSIENANRIAKLLNGEAYHNNMLKAEKERILDNFKSGQSSVICTVDMFNEGIDIPDARLLVFLRSTSSRTIFEQQLGRGLRRSPGKTHVTVLDFVANIERINFVRELGHTVSQYRGSGGGYSGFHTENGHGLSNTAIMQLNLNSFEFDDLVVRLLDKYEQLELPVLPPDRFTVKQVAHMTEQTIPVIKGLVKRRQVHPHYDEYRESVGGRKVYGFTAKQVDDLKEYLEQRSLQKPVDLETVKELLVQGMSVPKIAIKLKVSNVILYRRLKKAGIPYNTMKQLNINNKTIEKAYKEHGSISKTSKALDISPDTVSSRLQKLGYTFSKVAARYTDKEIEEAYLRNGKRLRKTASELRINHSSISVRLKKMGYDPDGRKLKISRDDLKAAYIRNNGKIKHLCAELGFGEAVVRRELQQYYYFKYDDATPKQMEAIEAYEKHGSGPAAANELGISGAWLYKLLREAGYTQRTYGVSKKKVSY